MEYNTGREHLNLPEYGRNVQKMIDYAITIKNKEERNKVARAIVGVMGTLTPQLRDTIDYKHKLWDHLFIISNYKLDVDSPYDKPSPDVLEKKPAKPSYPTNRLKYMHYGRNIELIIEEVKKMEEGPQKDVIVGMIGNFLKMSYLNWNRDVVTDETIIEHLKMLSDGKLSLSENTRLNHSSDLITRNVRKQAPPARGGGRNYRRNSGNGRSRKRM